MHRPPKVCYLDLTMGSYQQVLRLDVPVFACADAVVWRVKLGCKQRLSSIGMCNVYLVAS
jgi:hypothetical protein